jgi:hypothetical protein
MDNEHNTKREWTTKQLAEAARLTDAYIRQLLLADKLHGRKIGRDWVISNEEAVRFLEDRAEK